MSESHKDEALKLLASGTPPASIAKQFRVNIRTVFKWQAAQRLAETLDEVIKLGDVPHTTAEIMEALRASLGRTVAKLASNPNANDLLKAAKACRLIAERESTEPFEKATDMEAIAQLREAIGKQLSGLEAGNLGMSIDEYEAKILAEAEEKRQRWRAANKGSAH